MPEEAGRDPEEAAGGRAAGAPGLSEGRGEGRVPGALFEDAGLTDPVRVEFGPVRVGVGPVRGDVEPAAVLELLAGRASPVDARALRGRTDPKGGVEPAEGAELK